MGVVSSNYRLKKHKQEKQIRSSWTTWTPGDAKYRNTSDGKFMIHESDSNE